MLIFPKGTYLKNGCKYTHKKKKKSFNWREILHVAYAGNLYPDCPVSNASGPSGWAVNELGHLGLTRQFGSRCSLSPTSF